MIAFEELDTTKSCEGLVPAIIQDDTTLAVLMLGYMDRNALEKTQKEGRVTFYSRSKGKGPSARPRLPHGYDLLFCR